MKKPFAEVVKETGISSYTERQFDEDFYKYYGNDGLISTAKEAAIAVIYHCADRVNVDDYKIRQIIEMINKRKAELKNHASNADLCENIAEELLEEWKIATY